MPSKEDRHLSSKLGALAQGLDEVLEEQYGSGVGFVLIVAPFGKQPTEVQYVANIERKQAIEVIRELFNRWRQDLPDVPTHERQ